jgi:hypothetical protein
MRSQIATFARASATIRPPVSCLAGGTKRLSDVSKGVRDRAVSCLGPFGAGDNRRYRIEAKYVLPTLLVISMSTGTPPSRAYYARDG